MVTANTLHLNAVFGIALTLGHNAPIRTGHIHNNSKIRLLAELSDNPFGSFGAALLLAIGIVDDFFKIVKASCL